MGRFLRHNILWMCWALVVLCLYAVPGKDLGVISFWEIFSLDKFAHAIVFAILTLSMSVAFKKQAEFKLLRRHPFLLAVLIGVLYGGILEVIQGAFFEGRVTDVYDFLANSIGAIFGIVIFRIIYGRELTRS